MLELRLVRDPREGKGRGILPVRGYQEGERDDQQQPRCPRCPAVPAHYCELFHPEPGENNSPRVQAAIRICNQCPVRGPCLRWAFRVGDRFAILGGYTAHQRTYLLKKFRRTGGVAEGELIPPSLS